MRVLAFVVSVVLAGVGGALAGAAVSDDQRITVDTLDIYDGQPMPCERDQQFVWLDYPSNALCLDIPNWRRDETPSG